MSAKSYSKALDNLLLPLGFERKGPREWLRLTEGLYDLVLLEVVQDLGTTVSVHFKDDNTQALLKDADPDVKGPAIAHTRVGFLMGDKKRDRWWTRELHPKGPDELAAAVKDYGLPFLENLHSLEAQAVWCGPLHTNTWRPTVEQMWLAVTLYRMGRYDDARRVINDDSRPVNDHWRRSLERVRRWIEEKTAERS